MALVVQCALTDPSLLELSSVYEKYKDVSVSVNDMVGGRYA
jgi:hypothetical protein